MSLLYCVHTILHNIHPSFVAIQAALATCFLPLFSNNPRVAGLHSFDTAFPNAQHSSPQTDARKRSGGSGVDGAGGTSLESYRPWLQCALDG